MPIAVEFWSSLPPDPVSVAASGCKPEWRTVAAYLTEAFVASVGMARTVQRCDPVFEWVSVIAELRPSRNGTRLVVWRPNAAVEAGGVAVAVVVEVGVEVGVDGDDDGADAVAGAGVVADVGGCDVEPRSPG